MPVEPAAAEHIESVLLAIAAGDRSSRHQLPTMISDHVLGRVIQHCNEHALDGLLAHAVAEERLALTAAQRSRVADHQRGAMEHVLRVERLVVAVCAELAARGLEYRLLKGVALAHGVYADPSMRSFGDGDVLIHPADFARAVGLVAEMGGRRRIPPLRRGWDEAFGKEASIEVGGVTIDLHRRLIDGPFGQLTPTDALVSRGRSVMIGGRTLTTLDLADLYVHAALTAGAADDPPRLVTLRDLIELEHQPGFECRLILERAAEWKVECAVARAVMLLDTQLHPDDSPALLRWARNYRSTGRERLVMASYIGARRGVRRRLATMAVLPTWSRRAAFLRATLLPDRTYLAARSWGRVDQIRWGLRKLRR